MSCIYRIKAKIKRPSGKSVNRVGFYCDNTILGQSAIMVKKSATRQLQAMIDKDPVFAGCWVELTEVTPADVGFMLFPEKQQ